MGQFVGLLSARNVRTERDLRRGGFRPGEAASQCPRRFGGDDAGSSMARIGSTP